MFAWIVLGLFSGFIASRIINKSGRGLVTDIALGILGALIGGWLFNTFAMPGASGLNLYGDVVTIVGAVAVVMAHHFLVRHAQ